MEDSYGMRKVEFCNSRNPRYASFAVFSNNTPTFSDSFLKDYLIPESNTGAPTIGCNGFYGRNVHSTMSSIKGCKIKPKERRRKHQSYKLAKAGHIFWNYLELFRVSVLFFHYPRLVTSSCWNRSIGQSVALIPAWYSESFCRYLRVNGWRRLYTLPILASSAKSSCHVLWSLSHTHNYIVTNEYPFYLFALFVREKIMANTTKTHHTSIDRRTWTWQPGFEQCCLVMA